MGREEGIPLLLEFLTVVALAFVPPPADTSDTTSSPPPDTTRFPHPDSTDTTTARNPQSPEPVEPSPGIFKVSTVSFPPAGDIPARYTCEGADLSPALTWSGAPNGTRSFAVIVDDPDAPDPAAPRQVFVHWVAYDIPESVLALREGVKPGGLPRGGLDGINDWKKPGYNGPCPPIGKHRYFFKVYALDTVLPDLKRPTKSQLMEAMKGHVLANAEVMGMYEKARQAKRSTH